MQTVQNSDKQTKKSHDFVSELKQKKVERVNYENLVMQGRLE